MLYVNQFVFFWGGDKKIARIRSIAAKVSNRGVAMPTDTKDQRRPLGKCVERILRKSFQKHIKMEPEILCISCKLWVNMYTFGKGKSSQMAFCIFLLFLLSHIVCHRFQDPKCQDFVCWLVVSNIFYFHSYLRKISNLTYAGHATESAWADAERPDRSREWRIWLIFFKWVETTNQYACTTEAPYMFFQCRTANQHPRGRHLGIQRWSLESSSNV